MPKLRAEWPSEGENESFENERVLYEFWFAGIDYRHARDDSGTTPFPCGTPV